VCFGGVKGTVDRGMAGGSRGRGRGLGFAPDCSWVESAAVGAKYCVQAGFYVGG
jgi:hypothetical protein